MRRRAFTLVELLVVIAIMGMMGALSVGGYRAMRRGMEERSVMRTVNQFIRAAYQRAQIDRLPVAVYFWNETVAEDSGSEVLTVMGRAVAVRRAGRITKVDGNLLCDEFGDLAYLSAETAGIETSSSSASDSGMYIYQMNNGKNTQMMRSVVNTVTEEREINDAMLFSGDATRQVNFSDQRSNRDSGFHVYAYRISDRGSADWNTGDAYGFEFAEIELPKGFIFGTSYSTSVQTPVAGEDMIRFTVSQNSGSGASSGTSGKYSVQVSALRPDKSGSISPQKVGTSGNPTERMSTSLSGNGG
jgi:prepilin-type N-terminal cleavage/methylation domain-containing protein